jgi:hypothetical protein
MKLKLTFTATLLALSIMSFSHVAKAANYVTDYSPWQTTSSYMESRQVSDNVISVYDRNTDGTLDYLYEKTIQNVQHDMQNRTVTVRDLDTNQIVQQYQESQELTNVTGQRYEDRWVDGYYTTQTRDQITSASRYSNDYIVNQQDINHNGIMDYYHQVNQYEMQNHTQTTDTFKVENNISNYDHSTLYQYSVQNQVGQSFYWEIH